MNWRPIRGWTRLLHERGMKADSMPERLLIGPGSPPSLDPVYPELSPPLEPCRFWGRKESGSGLLTVSDPGLILPESACRWPQVFHTQGIRLCPMTLFNPVFNCLTPIVIKRSKTQARGGTDYSRRSWLCRSASAPSQRACEPVQDRCLGPSSRPGHAAGWRSHNRAPVGWVAWATNAITEGRARFRIGSQWFSRSGCWNRHASSPPARSLERRRSAVLISCLATGPPAGVGGELGPFPAA